MRVSLINVNLVAHDAIGSCIVNQFHFFTGRGDDTRIYVLHPPQAVPGDVAAMTRVVSLADLIGGEEEHFRLSDLYIFHYPGRHELMESIRGIDRGTVIFYYHNVTPPELWSSQADRQELIRGVEGRSLAHYADLCITPSPFNKKDLVEDVGCDADRVFVLPLAVPLERFGAGAKDPELVERYGLDGKQVLLFVGRMAGNKRIDLLVEALARVKRQAPDAKLLLVGDDRSAPAFREIVAAARERANTLGIADDVIWTGRVDDLPAHIRLADVYVTASRHEGFGVPLIEAMACDVPVVASRAGAMPWVLGDAGLLCEPEDVDDLAAKVLTLLQDAELRQALIARGRERVQEFSLARYEAGLAEIVDGAVAYSLPPMPAESQGGDEVARPSRSTAAREGLLLELLAEEIQAGSDVALRDYEVRSRIPLLGPVIVWVRRNMTSHLREPYLDPTIERQVELNRRLAEWARRAAQRQTALEARIEELEAQVQALARGTDSETPSEGEER